MSEKEEEEIKEGELNVDALDAAFDDHLGFGEEDVPLIEIKSDDSEEDEGGAEWRDDSVDDKDNW